MLPVLHSSSLSFLLQSACQQAKAAPPEDMVQRVESVGVCLQEGLSPDLEQPPSLCLFWGYQNLCSKVVSLKSVIPRVHTLRLQQERMTNLQPGPLVFSAFKHTQTHQRERRKLHPQTWGEKGDSRTFLGISPTLMLNSGTLSTTRNACVSQKRGAMFTGILGTIKNCPNSNDKYPH